MLQIDVDIKPDDMMMVDGLDLAGELIALAARLINPYVNQCPGCLDAVFGHIANHQLERIHRLMKDPEQKPQTGVLFCFADETIRNDVIRDHLDARAEEVVAIVESQVEPHHHH